MIDRVAAKRLSRIDPPRCPESRPRGRLNHVEVKLTPGLAPERVRERPCAAGAASACGPQRGALRGVYSDFVIPIRVFAHPKAAPQHASAGCRTAPNTGLGVRQEETRMSIKRNLLAAAAVLALASPAAAADIVETASLNGSFTTLVAAVKTAGLVDTLKGTGPFTVFAPTDEAFKKLPAGTVENLLKPENKAQLTKVLTYHVVPGKVMASDVKGKTTTAKTVEGSAVAIDASGSAVKVDNATVSKADVIASNGVIHVIDTVIMPKS